MSALVAGQRRYLTRVVGGDYGRDYFADRARVGRLHDLLGLEPDAYLGQYAVYYERLFDVLAERAVDGNGENRNSEGGATDDTAEAVEQFRDEALSVLKAFLLDQQLAIDTYVDSYVTEAEREARRQRSSRGASPNRSASRRRRSAKPPRKSPRRATGSTSSPADSRTGWTTSRERPTR